MPVISYRQYDFDRPAGPMSGDDFVYLKNLSPDEFSEYRSAVFAERRRRFWEDQGLLAKVAFVGGPVAVGALFLFRDENQLIEGISAFAILAAVIAALKFVPSWLSFVSADGRFRRWFQEMRDQVLVARSYEHYLITHGFVSRRSSEQEGPTSTSPIGNFKWFYCPPGPEPPLTMKSSTRDEDGEETMGGVDHMAMGGWRFGRVPTVPQRSPGEDPALAPVRVLLQRR